MPSNFPAGFDSFNEPSLPEETVLSSAGTGTRNHPEHHRDLGDAIEAMQHNMALKDHDHGGGTGDFDTQKLVQVHTHEEADTDAGDSSIHHTLGPNPGQAASGDHRHDYHGPSIFNKPTILCTSATRPGDPYPGLMIYETDTNRFRVWSTFDSNVTYDGLDSTEQFIGTFPSGMDPALWDVTLTSGDLVHGHPVTSGGFLSWEDGGEDTNRLIARRINPADAVTNTDDQVIQWKGGGDYIEDGFWSPGASNDIYFRMSADEQQYIRLKASNDWLDVWYTTAGRANEKSLGKVTNLPFNYPNMKWRAELRDRTMSIHRDGQFVGSIKDTKNASAKGSSHRGWGLGMTATERYSFFDDQHTPANLDWIRIQDFAYYYSTNRWTLLPVASVPVCRLRQGIRQNLIHTGSTIQWSDVIEDNFGYFNIASPTDIVIKEPGLYQIESTLQWDQKVVPDTASVILCINGLETTVRQQCWFRGGAQYTPGFSQTAQVMGKLRFAENDILTVKSKHVVPISLLGLIFSFFDTPSRVNSRLDITFLTP